MSARRSSRVLCASLLAVVALSCRGGDRDAPSDLRSAPLGGAVAASVGRDTIPLALVEAVARAQGISPSEAARALVDDAIAAEAARARGLDSEQPAAWRLVAARARLASDRLFEEARGEGPPTDAEVAALSERYWAAVDRPPTFRVVHAIVMRPTDDTLVPDARAAAAALRDAVHGASDRSDFERRAKAVALAPKLELRVEELPAFDEDGRVAEGGGRMDEVFARAAAALAPERATSGVVQTTFGWHVIRLIERLPEMRMPLEERRIAFTDEIVATRARERLRLRLEALRSTHAVGVSPSSEELMRSVTFSRPEAEVAE